MKKDMEKKMVKEERIELRVSSADKMIFKRAQELSGDKSFSSFIVRVVRKKAEEIVAKNNTILATQEDRQIFFDAVFDTKNQSPNQNLIDAAKRYQSKTASR